MPTLPPARAGAACAACAALVAVLSACAFSPGAADPTRLTVAVNADAGPLNPYVGAPDAMLSLVYDKLLEPSPYVGAPTPWLAEQVRQIDDLTWVVTLRDGISWHDGRPLTAADVRFTYEYYRDGPPTRHGHHVSAVPRVDRIEQIGPREVRFVCGYPCPTLDVVTMADLPILPAHIWSQISEPRKHSALPIGTGPFRLVEHQSDRFYRFTANESYFRGRPVIQTLFMPVVPDLSATFVGLRTGELDAAMRTVPPELVHEFGKLDTLKIVRTAALSILELRPNYAKPPFDEPEFRRALSLAVDRQALVDTVLLKLGRPGDRGYPHPDSPWTDPASRTPTDLKEASAILDRLEYRDRDGDGVRESAAGQPLRLTLHVSSATPAWVRVGELLVRQFAPLGLHLTLHALETGVFNERMQARQYDLFISETGAHATGDPDQYVMSHLSGYLWRPELPNPALSDRIEAWKATRTIDERRQAGFALQHLANREPTSIALLYPDAYWAYRPAAYDGWAESPGYGIVHKFSLLPVEARPPGVRPAS